MSVEWCGLITPMRQEPREGRVFIGCTTVPRHPPGGQAYGHIDAFDPVSGAKKWTVKMKYPLTVGRVLVAAMAIEAEPLTNL